MKKPFDIFLKDLPIRAKFLIINLVVIVTALLTSLVIISKISETATINTLSSQRSMFIQTENALSATTDTVLTVAESLSSQPFLYRLFYAGGSGSPLDYPDSEESAENFFKTVSNLVDGEVVTCLRVYLAPRYQEVYEKYSDRQVFYPISEIRSSYWHGIFSGRPFHNSLFCPDFYLTRRESSECGELAYIQKIRGSAASSEACFLAVYFSRKCLDQILRQNEDENESVYYIANSRDNLVATSDPALSGLYFQNYSDIAEGLPGDAQFGKKTVLGKELYMSYMDLSRADWRLVAAISTSALKERGRKIMLSQLCLYILTAVVLLLSELVMSVSLARRLTSISRGIHIRRNGKPKKLPEQNDMDEIGQLGRTYNSMVDAIDDLIDRNARTAEKLRSAEIRALQAQINPHFLYNMLDMINWLAISGNQAGVSRAVRSLSKFYRLSLSGRKLLIPIREELQHVSLYVLLQNMRYEDQINFIIDIPNEIMDCSIPKLVLQPVVENAMLHGIFEKESRKGTIVIMAWEETDSGTGKEIIVITVSDDGVGMDPEKARTITKGENRDDEDEDADEYRDEYRNEDRDEDRDGNRNEDDYRDRNENRNEDDYRYRNRDTDRDTALNGTSQGNSRENGQYSGSGSSNDGGSGNDGISGSGNGRDKVRGRRKARKGSGIAISNTHQRLLLFYGPPCGLSCTSEPGKGTEVQIRILKQPIISSPDSPEDPFSKRPGGSD